MLPCRRLFYVSLAVGLISNFHWLWWWPLPLFGAGAVACPDLFFILGFFAQNFFRTRLCNSALNFRFIFLVNHKMAGEDPLWPAAKQPSRFHLCVPFTETGFRTRQHPYGTLVYSPNTAELIVNLMNPDLAEQDYSYSVKVMAQNLPVVSGHSCFSMRIMLLFFSFFDWPAFDCFFGRTFQMNEEERRHHYMRLEGYKEHTHRVVKDQCSRRGFDIVEFHQPRDAQAYLRDHQFNTVKDRQVRVSIVGFVTLFMALF